MTFDKWFQKQTTLVKVLLLVFPVVGWVVEALVRLSVALRTKEVVHIVVFIIFLVFGFGWILSVADLIYLLVTGSLFLTE